MATHESLKKIESPALERIKSEIRSVLVSHPSKVVDINQFLKDYQNAVGIRLPFRAFGYHSPLQFLLSMPDVVNVKETNDSPKLTVVNTEFSSHLRDLVSKQKKTKFGKPTYANRKDMRVPQPRISRPLQQQMMPHHPFMPMPVPMPMNMVPFSRFFNQPAPFAPPQFMPAIPQPMFPEPMTYWQNSPVHQLNWPAIVPKPPDIAKEEIIPMPPDSAKEKNQTNSSMVKLDMANNSMTHAAVKEDLPVEQEQRNKGNGDVQHDKLIPLKVDLEQDASPRQTTGKYGRINAKTQWVSALRPRLTEDINSNIQKLVAQNPNGIDIDLFASLYQNKFGSELKPEKFGCNNIDELLNNCKSVKLRGYGNKNIVYANNWLQGKLPPLLGVEIDAPDEQPFKLQEVIKDVWKGFFKDTECDPTFKFQPPSIPEGRFHRVKLVDVFSPACFYLQFCRNIQNLDNLMFRLNFHYSTDQENYLLSERMVVPGLPVTCVFNELWHRAVITNVYGKTVELFYVDYGTWTTTDLKNLRKLDRQFAKDPTYAVNASFFCLVPPGGESWCEESHNRLYYDYCDHILFAEICQINSKGPLLDVILYDISNKEETNLSEYLIQKGLARYCVNPASVMNESMISGLLKFLPWWFSLPHRNMNESSSCCELLSQCNPLAADPPNSDDKPCCLSDLLLKLLKKNPESLIHAWTGAVQFHRDKLIKFVTDELCDSIANLGWTDCLVNGTVVCSNHDQEQSRENKSDNQQEYSQYPTEEVVNNHMKENHDDNLKNSNQLVATRHTEASLKLFDKDSLCVEKKDESCVSEATPGSLPTVLYRPPHQDTSPRSNVELIRRFQPQVIRYIETRVFDSKLIIIEYQQQLRVTLSQLLLVARITPLLVQHRLSSAGKTFQSMMVVGRNANPQLYSDLLELGLVPSPCDDPVLVSLDDAGEILNIINPPVNYSKFFPILIDDLMGNGFRLIGPDENRPFQREIDQNCEP